MLIGKELEVLTEAKARRGEGKLMGRTLCFRKVNFSADDSMIGDLKTVRITGASPSASQENSFNQYYAKLLIVVL